VRASFGNGVHLIVTLASLLACSERTSADSAGAAKAPTFSAPPGSMPLLSRVVPASSSSGNARWAQDAVVASFAPDHMWSCRGDCWLAYDLSGVPEGLRSRIYLALYFGGNAQSQLNVHALRDMDLRGVPTGGYRIEASHSSSGPWTTLVTVPSLAQASRVHLVDFQGYTWVRYLSPDATRLKMNVYSAAEGLSEGLVLYGDSIANLFFAAPPQSWFSSAVEAQAPGRFPPIVGGGIAYLTSMDGRDLIVKGSGPFSTGMGGPLLDVYSPVAFLGLAYGVNDAASGAATNEQAFFEAYRDIIRAALAKGMKVAIATPTWSPDLNRQQGLKRLLGRIGLHTRVVPDWSPKSYQLLEQVWRDGKVYRCVQAGTSRDGPSGVWSSSSDGGSARWQYVPSLRETFAKEVGDRRLQAGPDFYSLFTDQPSWLADGLHPNRAGAVIWQKAWVDWALVNMYR
jgi:lysophospholipase L1-like esterase